MFRVQVNVAQILGALVLVTEAGPECTCGECPPRQELYLSQKDVFESISTLKVGDKLETGDSGQRFYRVDEFTVEPEILAFENFLQGVTGFGPQPSERKFGDLN